jgi:hypothetical protein
MTSNVIANGWGAAGSSESNTFEAFKAFDNDTGTSWLAGTGQLVPQWIAAVRNPLLTGETMIAYAVTADTYVGSPKDFKLQGSNNGSSWVDLNSQTGVTWSGTLRKQYSISSPASYTYYRLYITAVQDNAYEPAVIGLELLRYGAVYSPTINFVSNPQTFKAVGVKTGYIDSAVMSETYTQAQVATPTAAPAGGAISFPTTIVLSCATSGAAIYFTTNGSTPTSASVQYNTGSSLVIPSMTSDSFAGSDGTYVSSASGYISGGYEPFRAFDDNAGGLMNTIWGTTNSGSWPVWLKIALPVARTITGYKVGNGHGSTSYYARAWTLQGSNDNSSWTTLDSQTLANPWNGALTTFNLGSPVTYRYYQLVITANNGGVTTSVGVFQLIGNAGVPVINSNVTLKAIGIKSTYLDSSVMSEAYTQAQLPVVVFNPVDGTSGVSLVTLTNAVSGTTIRYTTNGSTPTISNGFTYSGPIGIVTPKTVKAYAYKTGYIDSNVATATYP